MKCQHCSINKDESEFPVRNDRSGRLRPYCKECAADIQQARYTHHRKTKPFKHRCTRARSRARGLGVPFDLTPEYLEEIWTGTCPVRKVNLNLVTDRKDEDAAELDRFNPELGYVKGNVHWLSRKANRLKNNSDVETLTNLIEWMKKIERNLY